MAALGLLRRKMSSALNVGYRYFKRVVPLDERKARATWKQADAVCFDVDSTVVTNETIVQLAKFRKCEEEVSDLANKAMSGEMPLKLSLLKTFVLMQPSRQLMDEFLQQYKPSLTPGIEELVGTLQERNVPVYLVSGGLDSIIEPTAKLLNIPSDHVFANRLKYYYEGDYAGLDEEQPTSEQNGKARVLSYLKTNFAYKRIVMVGDGVTDLVACPPADSFIGFGGNQIRETVRKEAKWFVMCFDELQSELLSA